MVINTTDYNQKKKITWHGGNETKQSASISHWFMSGQLVNISLMTGGHIR